MFTGLIFTFGSLFFTILLFIVYFSKQRFLSIRNKMNDELINAMAASLDVIVDDGDIDKRFSSLLSCVSMMEKFEVNNRLR